MRELTFVSLVCKTWISNNDCRSVVVVVTYAKRRGLITVQGSRSLSPNFPTRDDQKFSRIRAYTYPKDSRSRAPTAAPRDVRPLPPPYTSTCPTGSRSHATTSTLRAVPSSPLPDKGIHHATEDLAVAGAATRLNIRAPRHASHQAPQTEAPFLPPRRASHGSPLGASRDRRGRRNAHI